MIASSCSDSFVDRGYGAVERLPHIFVDRYGHLEGLIGQALTRLLGPMGAVCLVAATT